MGSRGFQSVGVAFDKGISKQKATDFAKLLAVSYPVGYTSSDKVDSYLGREANQRFRVPQIVIIDRKGVFTVPDILGNAGGVTVSYFEWVQDRQGFFWREQEVNERLLDIMEHAFDEVVRYAESHKVNNRIAAYMLAIDRVANALKLRGIYA